MEINLTPEESKRYDRHLILPEFGLQAQLKLKNAKILVVGAGALSSPLLYYLASAGVGKIGIIDADKIETSNLQRQILYHTDEIGLLKVEIAKKKLELLNPNTTIEIFPFHLSTKNALEIIAKYDLVADGTANFPSRYLINDACVLSKKPLVYASVFQYEGQVSVFNYVDNEGKRGPNYRDLYPIPPAPGTIPSSSEGGVLGVLAGIIGSMQANECIKIIAGVGEVLSGRLFTFNSLEFKSRTTYINTHPENPLTGENPKQKELIDYRQFCGLSDHHLGKIKNINALELKEWINNKKDFQLIDVREPYEFEIENIGGQLIPKASIIHNIEDIEKSKQVVFYCKTGKKSREVIELLEREFGMTNLYHLKGGVDQWKKVLKR